MLPSFLCFAIISAVSITGNGQSVGVGNKVENNNGDNQGNVVGDNQGNIVGDNQGNIVGDNQGRISIGGHEIHSSTSVTSIIARAQGHFYHYECAIYA